MVHVIIRLYVFVAKKSVPTAILTTIILCNFFKLSRRANMWGVREFMDIVAEHHNQT